jgi:hypothetical protein
MSCGPVRLKAGTNMDEVILNGTKSKLDVTTELHAFGLVILILTLTPFPSAVLH